MLMQPRLVPGALSRHFNWHPDVAQAESGVLGAREGDTDGTERASTAAGSLAHSLMLAAANHLL